MPSSYPTGLDTFTTGTLTGVVSGSDHGNKGDAINKIQAELGLSPSASQATVKARLDSWGANVKDYGALGDGTTDDTTAIHAARDAAGVGGVVFFPVGVYRGDSLTPLAFQMWVGTGMGGTGLTGSCIKAKASATQAVSINGVSGVKLENLAVDGNAEASIGLRVTGGASVSSQSHSFDHVLFLNCSTAVDIQQGTVPQVDKNTWRSCWFIQSGTLVRVNSVNGQTQQFDNCVFSGFSAYGIRLTAGAIQMNGGEIVSGSGTAPGLLIDGANVQWASFRNVIWEAMHTAVKGANWPQDGLYLKQCTMTGSSKIIDCTVATAAMTHASQCRFNGAADVEFAGSSDHVFVDEHNTYAGGAAYVAGTVSRRYHYDGNGVDWQSHDSVIRSLVASSNPLTIDGASAQSSALLPFKVNGTLKSQINSGGEHVSDDATKGIVLKDTQGTPHFWRVTVSNAGALVITDAGTTRPD